MNQLHEGDTVKIIVDGVPVQGKIVGTFKLHTLLVEGHDGQLYWCEGAPVERMG